MRRWIGCAGIAALATVGCETNVEERAEATPAADTVAQPAGYAVVDVANGGIVRGVVRLEGRPPETRVVAITDNTATCGETRLLPRLSVGSANEIEGAVVSLANASRGAARTPSPEPPTLDQRGCTFDPHVVLAYTGQTVRVLNSDPLTHNVHTKGFDNRPVNRTQPAAMRALDLSFTAPERVKVNCDLHPWMEAWIVVIDHPYHAVTDARGAFELRDVPPGTYTVEVWHPAIGVERAEVVVNAVDTTDVQLDLGG